MNNSLEKIIESIKNMGQHLGVIATASMEGKPEAAVVYFSCDEHLNIYITTRSDSRKYGNMVKNPKVAFVMFSENPPETVQLEGTITRITDPYEQTVLFSELVERAGMSNNGKPPIDQLSESEIAFIKISPTWIRMGNFEITRKGDMFEEVNVIRN